MAQRHLQLALCVLIVSLVGCGDQGGDGSDAVAKTPQADRVHDFADRYANVIEADYAEALRGARGLEGRITTFCAAPSSDNLVAAQQAWLVARPAYQRSEVARFYGGPIDREGGPEPDLNPWPLDEVYIDSVGDGPSGIIGSPDRYPEITEAMLRKANGSGGEENICTGWHAIEFMLWGVDNNPDGPGQRDWRDFVDGAEPLKLGERRCQYLGLLARMLVSDLARVHAEWIAESGAYRQEFVAAQPTEILRRVLTGMGTLAKGELHGERILVPYTTKEQEDEHSCFSDTTHRDHRENLAGIEGVWRKAGLRKLAADAGCDVSAVDAALNETAAAMDSPHFSPFDRAILGTDSDPGRTVVAKAIKGLKRFDGELSRLAENLGVAIVTTLPN